MFRKKKGDSAVVSGMIVTILTLMVIITAVFAYTSWQTQLEHTYEIDLVMHKYLAEMESADFSDQSTINALYASLEAELEQHHVSGIRFTGSTLTPVSSGEKITLHMTGNMDIYYVTMPENGGLTDAFRTAKTINLDITKSGTAMY